jgi:hypothetical protein
MNSAQPRSSAEPAGFEFALSDDAHRRHFESAVISGIKSDFGAVLDQRLWLTKYLRYQYASCSKRRSSCTLDSPRR